MGAAIWLLPGCSRLPVVAPGRFALAPDPPSRQSFAATPRLRPSVARARSVPALRCRAAHDDVASTGSASRHEARDRRSTRPETRSGEDDGRRRSHAGGAHARGEGGADRRRGDVRHPRCRASGAPGHPRHRRSQRRPRSQLSGLGRSRLHLHPVRLGHRRDVGPGRGRGAGLARGPGRARPGVPGPAGADGEPAPFAAGRAQFRVLFRGPAPLRETGGRVRPRSPVRRCVRHREALRVQRRGIRAVHDELGGRPAHDARAVPRPVRDRGEGGWRAGRHVLVQPGQRELG